MNQTELFDEHKIEDGGHIFLVCSNCEKQLMEIWVQRPHEKMTTKVKAKCPYCHDSSFIKEIKGGFAYSGIAIDKQQGESDFVSIFLTKVVSFAQEDEVYVFNITKG